MANWYKFNVRQALQDLKWIPSGYREVYGDEFLVYAMSKFPFQHWPVWEDLKYMYEKVYAGLENAGYTPTIFGGSALGLTRDGVLLPWDNDIDFGIPTTDYEYPDFKKHIFEILGDEFSYGYDKRQHKCGNLVHLRIKGIKGHIDVKFFSVKEDILVFDGGQLPGFKKEWFDKPKRINSMGTKFLIPNPPEEYCEYDFGSNWRERIPGGFAAWEHKTTDCWKWKEGRRY